jgi:hypothetical protein
MVSNQPKLSGHVMHDEQDGGRVERGVPDSDRYVIDGRGAYGT